MEELAFRYEERWVIVEMLKHVVLFVLDVVGVGIQSGTTLLIVETFKNEHNLAQWVGE